jgi:TonB-linked SusC/RagA family outer membrane protein
MITTFALVICSLQMQAKDSAINDISLAKSAVPLKEVLTDIEAQSQYHFFYNNRQVDDARKVSVHVKSVPLVAVLDNLFRGTAVLYRISGKQILLYKESFRSVLPLEIRVNKKPMFPDPDAPRAISGKVISETGDGLPGVNVTIKGTSVGTITNADGDYTINAEEQDVLVFSFIGYTTVEIPVGSQSIINARMEPDVQELSEVVVIGYGTVEKSDITGAVSSLRAEDFNPGVNASVDQMMLGRAAGVQISQSSSEPGGGLSIRIRGASSINASNEPLYVIDGFPIDNSSNLSSNGIGTDPNNPGGGFSLGNNFSPKNPLNSLNPADIESIEILKDASATAIYGSRGANGVIMITTKKGKSDKMTLSYNAYFGSQRIAEDIDVLSTQEYIQFMNDVSVDQGNGEVFSAADIEAIGAGTDWQKQIYRTAPISDNNISLTGGIGSSKIYASLDYFNQEGIVKNTGIKKYIGRLNLDSKLGEKVNIGFNLTSSLILDRNSIDGVNTNESSGPIYASLLYDPTEQIYNPDGTFTVHPLLTINNPMSLIAGVSSKNHTTRTLANFSVSYEIFKGFTAKLNLGADLQNSRRDVYVSTLTNRGGPQKGYADVTTLDRGNYLAEYTMTYDKEINENHKFNILGGITYQKFNYGLFNANISGFPTDAIETYNLSLGDTNTDNLLTNREDNTLLSYLGRLNYTLFDKFLVTGSIRADGSSRFGENNKYGYFPSFAVGYKLSDESFVPEFFEELKLRGSWGKTGNQEIANYASQLTFGTGPFVVFGGDVTGSTQPLRIANPDLKWETTTQFNVGLDASILGGKISTTLDYFSKNTTDLLFNLPLPVASGYASILTNIGEVTNKGFEVLINSNNVSTTNFSWNTSFNFTAIKNEVVDLGRIDQIVTGNIQAVGNTAIIKVGSPLAAYYGYEVTGIQQQGDSNPGYPAFKDQNGDEAITPADQLIIGNPFPDFTYGLNNQLKYKNWELSFFFQGVEGADLLNINVIESMYPSNFRRNRLTTMLDRWTPENTGAKWPSAVDPNSYAGSKVNTMVLQDASYFRLKNVQVSYSFPMSKIKFLKALKIYATGQNLFTITDYVGFDPEANSFGRNNVKLDYSSYPLARIYTLGVNATF